MVEYQISDVMNQLLEIRKKQQQLENYIYYQSLMLADAIELLKSIRKELKF